MVRDRGFYPKGEEKTSWGNQEKKGCSEKKLEIGRKKMNSSM